MKDPEGLGIAQLLVEVGGLVQIGDQEGDRGNAGQLSRRENLTGKQLPE
jgi:hypothetical protein